MYGAEEIIVGKENITKELCNVLADDYHAELANAEVEQKKLMEAEARVSKGERKNLSFGYLRMKVCPEVYHFWGRKLGYEYWKDRTFISWLEKRHGDLVSVKSKSAKIGI